MVADTLLRAPLDAPPGAVTAGLAAGPGVPSVSLGLRRIPVAPDGPLIPRVEILLPGAPVGDRWTRRMAERARQEELIRDVLRTRVAEWGRMPGDTSAFLPAPPPPPVRIAPQQAADDELPRFVTDFADLLTLGLETPVGEGGLGLSGGEAHRVALARIYLRSPDIVLLDEPTAHLDGATEARVIDGILDFARGRTLIVATHSRTLAARMERSLRVAGGQLMPVLGAKPKTVSRSGGVA